MSVVKLIYYQENRECPVDSWLKKQDYRVQSKAELRLRRLKELGHALRRPEADYLRDGIYELRWRVPHVNYRILYFFHGQGLIVVSHALTKEGVIPSKDIELAIHRKNKFILSFQENGQ